MCVCVRTYLWQRWGEVVAVLVHEVVGVAFVLLPHLLHDPLHILLCEVCAAQDYGFSTETSGERVWRQVSLDIITHWWNIKNNFLALCLNLVCTINGPDARTIISSHLILFLHILEFVNLEFMQCLELNTNVSMLTCWWHVGIIYTILVWCVSMVTFAN